MFVIAVMSCKGGVGRTTLVTNLAAVLSELGQAVTVIEYDPQGGLPAHYGRPASLAGWAAAWLAGESPVTALHQIDSLLRILPFGALPAGSHAGMAQALPTRAPLPELLAALCDAAGQQVVLIDVPPGRNAYAEQALAEADAVLSLWLCDTASWRAHEMGWEPVPASGRHQHVINQINATRPARREVFKQWRQRLGSALLPVPVHQDESVSDALRDGAPVVRQYRHSQAAHDLHGIANWLVANWLRGSAR